MLYHAARESTPNISAEEGIRTIKSRIYEYLTQNTLRYIDELPKFVSAYNNATHRNLKATPEHVHQMKDIKQIIQLFDRMYKYPLRKQKALSRPHRVGDVVRLQGKARTQDIFQKSYYPQNTVELFRVKEVDFSQPIPIYKIEDLGGEVIDGTFYGPELIAAKIPDTFPIDVIKSKVVRGKRMYFVKWRGYPERFNSWVNANDIVLL